MTGNKETIVVVGGGFAGMNFIKRIDRDRYDVILVAQIRRMSTLTGLLLPTLTTSRFCSVTSNFD